MEHREPQGWSRSLQHIIQEKLGGKRVQTTRVHGSLKEWQWIPCLGLCDIAGGVNVAFSLRFSRLASGELDNRPKIRLGLIWCQAGRGTFVGTGRTRGIPIYRM